MAFCESCGKALTEGSRFCPGCGRALTPLAPEEAPDTMAMAPAGPTPPPDPSPAPGWSATTAAPATAPQPGRPDMWSAGSGPAGGPPPSARRSLNPRLLALVAGVSVLALIGYLVVSGLLGRGPSGAASPEDAVKGFVTALESKDIAAVAAALNPNEERQFVSLVEQVQKTAEVAGVTQKGQELAGFDVKVTNVTYDTKNLSQRLARVDITGGKITVATGDKSKLPDALKSLTVDPSVATLDLGTLKTGTRGDQPEGTDRLGVRPFVMVVKEERGWFVSPLFTGAELLAQGQRVLGSYQDVLPTATTEKTAVDAVKAFLKAVASKDPDAVLARLTPQEQSVLRTYDRLWRPYLNDAMGTEAWNATSLQLNLNKMTDTDLGDGSTGVAIDSADVAVASNNGSHGYFDSGKYSLEKDCVQGIPNGALCLKPLMNSIRSYDSEDSASAQQGGTSARATLVAVKTGDGYAVSLLGSAAATGRSALAALDAKEIFRALNMHFLLPTGGSLGVGRQLTVDAALTDNVTLNVEKGAKIVVKADESDRNGQTTVAYVQLYGSRGTSAFTTPSDGSSYDSSDTSSGTVFELDPGSYRITWSTSSSRTDSSKITISATTQ